jgi:peroxiredoxin
MRSLATIAALLAAGIPALAETPAAPRKAPEFTITEPSGKQTLLSSYKGKVVVLSFIFTTCEHCQNFSRMVTKLYKEMGPRGFQPVGVAFNDNAAVLVPGFVQSIGVTYPIGYSKSDPVLNYLGYSVVDNYFVPQVVVIDRKGMIRAQSPLRTDPNLQDENYLRKMIDGLLNEGAATGTAKKAPAAKKKTS